MFKYNVVQVLLFLMLIFTGIDCQRAKDKMYENIKTSAACFRKMNATHQTGCTSAPSGSTGVVHVIESQKDLNFLLENGTAPPYIPIMPVSLFRHEIMHVLKNSNKISGLIVFKQNFSSLTHYTHDLKCPNELSNIEGTCKHQWNEYGTGLLFEDYPFPIFYLDNDSYVQKIVDCFKKFNDFDYSSQYERSLCSLELTSFMFATTDTPTCMRRSNSKNNLNPVKFCDPMGDKNVFASLFPLENTTDSTDKKYIVVASRMDTTSFFNDVYPGAINPVTSLVTLLSTANLLKKMLPENNNFDKNVLFVVFSGETYDYIGSQRMVYDMQQGVFPVPFDASVQNPVPQIRLEDIGLYVELNQLSKAKEIVAHTLIEDRELANFVTMLRNYNPNVNLKFSKGLLPPCSLHSFLKEKPDFRGLVLTDHQIGYSNHFYNSIYDTVENIDYYYYNVTPENTSNIPKDSIQAYVANISTMISKALYESVTGNKYNNSNLYADIVLVDELFSCYLTNPNCKVHKAIQKNEFAEEPLSLYVGVPVAPNLIRSLIGLTLGWLTGNVYELKDNKTCTNDPKTPAFQYFHMSKSLQDLNNTVCYQTTMNFSEAVSPAFIIPDYDWRSGKYSSWTESTWRDFNVRMYLQPSPAHEKFTIALGSITFILSLILIYFVKSRSNILFPAPPPECAPTNC
ncbi:nicastrin [Agrilus planipennis]|uniref:Nicastrin n=1 Tax=Agrilus planipennis TaxID=224129 RepID=A0A7F5R4V7_AGRPL|nr:nicastrin [Agrilus planipennis]